MVILKRLRWKRLSENFFTRENYASNGHDSKCVWKFTPWRIEWRVTRMFWVNIREVTGFQTSISIEKFFYGHVKQPTAGTKEVTFFKFFVDKFAISAQGTHLMMPMSFVKWNTFQVFKKPGGSFGLRGRIHWENGHQNSISPKKLQTLTLNENQPLYQNIWIFEVKLNFDGHFLSGYVSDAEMNPRAF